MLTLIEAAQRYHVSVNALRKWIYASILPAHQIVLRGRTIYLLDPIELEKVLTDRGMVPRSSIELPQAHYQDQLDALTHRLDNAERKISQLEATLARFLAKDTPTDHHTTHAPLAVSQSGQIALHLFQHGIAYSTARRWRDTHLQYCSETREGGRKVYLLSPEGQHAYYLWACTRPDFVACEQCPHATKREPVI